MPLDYDKLRAYDIPDVEARIGEDDTILYALAVGLGADPTDPRQLRYVYEDGLEALPTFASIMAIRYGWTRSAAIGSAGKAVQAGISVELPRPLPTSGHFVGRTRLVEAVDKGPGRAAILATEREITSAEDGSIVARVGATVLLREDGGFGGPATSSLPDHPAPQRAPDATADMPTLPQSALVYRLTGDRNPLHADVDAARKTGFDRPILHGLCTFGVAGHAILREACDYDAARIAAIGARFVRPVYPGDTISVDVWRDGNDVRFTGRVATRGDVVLTDGYAVLR